LERNNDDDAASELVMVLVVMMTWLSFGGSCGILVGLEVVGLVVGLGGVGGVGFFGS